VAVPPAPQSQPGFNDDGVRVTFLGGWWAAALLVCTTLAALGSAMTAFLLYLRPFLLVLASHPPS
jgi:hypothetical protein